MSIDTISSFKSTLQKSDEWIKDMQAALPVAASEQDAYHALRAGLHCLRDRLPTNESVHLSAQMPMLIRGLYFEGWQPSETPMLMDNLDEISSYLTNAIHRDISSDPMVIMKALFSVLHKHISEGELSHIQSMLPAETRVFWPNLVE